MPWLQRYKTCLRSFRPGHAQNNLLSYRDYIEKIEILLLLCFDIILSNMGITKVIALMRRLVRAFVVCKLQRQGFLCQDPYISVIYTIYFGSAVAQW